MTSIPAGWRTEPVRVLGARREIGDGYFRLGRRPQIRAVTLPTSRAQALLVANELADVRLYRGFLGGSPQSVPLRIVGDRGPSDLALLGYSGTGLPDAYRYLAAFPRPDGAGWDLIICGSLSGMLERCAWIAEDAEVKLDWPRRIADWGRDGIPEAVDWRRDGRHHLLIGRPNGSVLRFARRAGAAAPEFEPAPEAVVAGRAPIDLPAPVCPCVVDWFDRGRSDLLVGAGDGFVWLFQDIGDAKAVRYERGRLLVNAEGYVRVRGAASPTVLRENGTRALVVADGDGAVWSWELRQADSYVTADLYAACGGEARGVYPGYRRGQWWVMKDRDRAVLCAAPEQPVGKTSHKSVATVFDPLAPELRLRPPVQGNCEVHVTLHGRAPSTAEAADDFGVSEETVVKVRLSDEPVGEYLSTGEGIGAPSREIFFKSADVTGRELCLSQLAGGLQYEGGFPAYVAAVRFTPIDPVPAAPRRAAPVVAGISDTMDWVNHVRMDTAAEVDEFVAQHARAGMQVLYMKLGGASWEYPSKHADARGVVPDLPGYTELDKVYCRRQTDMLERVNRLQWAAEACHRRGMRCLGQMRIQNESEHIVQQTNLDRFFVEHPELMDKDVLGNATRKLCLAYPQVRDYYCRIAAEVVEFGMDGILVETLRHLPKVMYGDPVIEEFRGRHGLDMRSLPPFDPRVVELQCEIFARFMREMRQAIRAVNPRSELQIRVCKPYALMGVDPVRLAREGIVDEIMIKHRSRTPREPDIAGLVEAIRGTACRASACFARTHLWGREQFPLHPYIVETKAREFVGAGACAVAFYETVMVLRYPQLRRAISRITDPSELPSRVF